MENRRLIPRAEGSVNVRGQTPFNKHAALAARVKKAN